TTGTGNRPGIRAALRTGRVPGEVTSSIQSRQVWQLEGLARDQRREDRSINRIEDQSSDIRQGNLTTDHLIQGAGHEIQVADGRNGDTAAANHAGNAHAALGSTIHQRITEAEADLSTVTVIVSNQVAAHAKRQSRCDIRNLFKTDRRQQVA